MTTCIGCCRITVKLTHFCSYELVVTLEIYSEEIDVPLGVRSALSVHYCYSIIYMQYYRKMITRNDISCETIHHDIFKSPVVDNSSLLELCHDLFTCNVLRTLLELFNQLDYVSVSNFNFKVVTGTHFL